MSSIDPSRCDQAAATLLRVFADALPRGYREPMPARCVRVLLLDAVQWHTSRTATGKWLDSAETARVARKRFAQDRELLTLAYAAHRLWLAVSLRCDPIQVPLIRDQRGCPQVPGTPLHTSLSHCDTAVAIALSTAGAIGIDIEPASRAHGLSDLAERIAHPAELVTLDGLPAHAREAMLLRLWVRKEAWLKAAGVGLAWEMSAFAAATDAPVVFAGHPELDLQVTDFTEPAAWYAATAVAPGVAVDWAWLQPDNASLA